VQAPTQAAPPLLLLERVTKTYGGRIQTHALRGIDLRVDAGEFVALTGPSGSGKSTLLNLIGLLDRPSTGRLSFQGQDVADLDEAGTTATRGRGIGFVFQFHHLLPAFTALENVMLPVLAERGRPDAAMRDRAAMLLDEVGLADRASYPATDLSGGQQQRVAVARALVMDPPLVLADEPTGNLDSESGEQVLALLRNINERRGTAFVIVTHDERLAARCDRIVHVVDGVVDSDTRSAGAA
jgi:lipoprotein-releasing system ATP-binding protein